MQPTNLGRCRLVRAYEAGFDFSATDFDTNLNKLLQRSGAG